MEEEVDEVLVSSVCKHIYFIGEHLLYVTLCLFYNFFLSSFIQVSKNPDISDGFNSFDQQ